MSLLQFLRENGRLVTFGFFMCFCSSVGQTFFISLFNGELRHAFALSHGDIGSLYAMGTIASAVTLIFAGRAIDRVSLPGVATVVLVGLALAALGMGIVWSAASLAVVFFGLRLFGQGLSSHTAMTAMGRYFDAARGRAIALASVGYSTGEALLPSVIVVLLPLVFWQSIWLLAALIVLMAIPVARWLLGATGSNPQASALPQDREAAAGRQWKLGDVLRDPCLWLRLPALLSSPFILTGIFFHQVQLAAEKGWPLALMAGSFSAYAVVSFLTTLASGLVIDRRTARAAMPVFLLPLMLSCLLLAASAHPLVAPAFMILIGLNTGIYGIVSSAIWPEIYGVRHLGSIKAFAQSAMVLASGLAPVVFGILIDRRVAMDLIAIGCALWCVAASILAAVAEAVHRRG
ncbi:MAG: MFS transporter [Parvibaculaceae bacterium]